jgi:DNA polymerase-3 subunit beta
MVATDGHRLAYCEDNVFESTPNTIPAKGIIIPRKGVLELRKLLESGNEHYKMSVDGNHLIFNTDRTYLFIRLIEGKFPDYKQVIPKNNPNVLIINSQELTLSLKRVSLLANEKSKGVKLSVNGNKLEISTNNPDIGEAKESIDIDYKGQPIEIGFNAKYLMDSIAAISEEKMSLSLNDKMSPGVVRVLNDESYLCVLMPMRL